MAETDSDGVAATEAANDGGPLVRVDGPTVDLLVLSDLHLRATGERFPVAELPVESHDLVLSLGDVIDENREHAPSAAAGEAYEERGRAFLEALDERGVPVLAVPGNHDPVDCTRRLCEGLENVEPLHHAVRRVVADGGGWSLTFAGWGCEAFDFRSALLAPDYPDITVEGDAETADAVAAALLGAASWYVAGEGDARTLAERLGIDPADQAFKASRADLEDRFETLVELLDPAPDPVVLTSHISPFGVPFDVRGQHSHDGDVHLGSVALRLAVAATGPIGCLSGHSHQRGTTVLETTDGHAYAHNPGGRGVSSMTVRRDGTLQVESLDVGWG